MKNGNKPVHSDIWRFQVEGILPVKMVHWGADREHESLKPLNNGKGVWNYYIMLPEWILKDKFPSIWLDDLVNESYSYISHDYMNASFADVYWHGDLTFYTKLGHTKGYRAVEVGCDYNHLFDMEQDYDLESVVSESTETALQLINLYNLYGLTKP